MSMTGAYGAVVEKQEMISVIRAAVERAVKFFDTDQSQVGPTIQKPSDQIKVVRLDLHAVESCFQSILCRDAKIGYRLANFYFGHWAGSDSWLATRRGNAYLLRIHRRS